VSPSASVVSALFSAGFAAGVSAGVAVVDSVVSWAITEPTHTNAPRIATAIPVENNRPSDGNIPRTPFW
ncbi:MAG: hypothetical protein VYA62_04750, partial [Planctomycetota bacterium]|nr:hypothetical protein [Planctomycetota bacterium]